MRLRQLFQVKLKVFTAFNPETAGQTEQFNQILERYLCSDCSYQQDDWVSLLPFAEHAYNISLSESAKATDFDIKYGFTPLRQWLGIVSDNQEILPDSKHVVKDWEGMWQEIQETLKQAQQRQRKWHDPKKQLSPAYVTLEDVSQGRAMKADGLMLNQRNLHTKWSMVKVDHKMFGPFVAKRKVGSSAYELELPTRWTINSVFNIVLLEPYCEDPIARPQLAIAAPDIGDSDPGYVV